MTVPSSPLVTDLYQLTMIQGYWLAGIHRREACFDYFFRHQPFGSGYTVFAGLEDTLRFLEGLRFAGPELDYLRSLDLFRPELIEHLRALRFTGQVHAVPEGSLIFPIEPVLRVQGPLEECQLVESALLNTLNFQSLIATKAARVCQEAGGDNVMEFGLRRAQGVDGALSAARAAYIGGCAATSNVQAGQTYGIPVSGTHAHSWVLAFPSELEAFRQFARAYPTKCILLVDTYDTLRSGVPNAIRVGLEMKARGERLAGIRLDSGDLAYLSAEARRMLDEAGLTDTLICCSSDLDEFIIRDLNAQGARIDLYGVGTNLVTARGEPALPGVYKIAALRGEGDEWQMKLKWSEGLKKSTLPGIKQVWRLRGPEGSMLADWIEMDGITPDVEQGLWGFHPSDDHAKTLYAGIDRAEPLLVPVLRDGTVCADLPPLGRIRDRVRGELEGLHPTMRRLLNPHVYKVSLGPELKAITTRMLDQTGR